MSDQSEIDYPSQWLRARAPGQDSIAKVKATFRVRTDLEPEFGVTTVSCASELSLLGVQGCEVCGFPRPGITIGERRWRGPDA